MTRQLQFNIKSESQLWWREHAERCCRSAARCEFDENIIDLLQMAIISIARSEA